ncbi:glycerophosphoryl diester phosphodiesterase [Planoprotostelium fungivorum]|uniref:glycerophosphodiester phosphodiesterase n=1 Tax=Planoprotostelium fungivorum TaxID=1890364 RepID=A0A2P6NSS9_9EUKA|nr:glycerophosphoryl diester phosphodiesterase [Planoprotostelium fungivorum]
MMIVYKRQLVQRNPFVPAGALCDLSSSVALMAHLKIWILFLSIFSANALSAFTGPVIVAHRGASGYRPEESLSAWDLAAQQDADYLEVDIVSSKDGKLFCMHSNEMSITTDIAMRPEFSQRRTTKMVDGIQETGWFTEDFSSVEISTLRLKESLAFRPQLYNGIFHVPTLQDYLRIVRAKETDLKRKFGLYIETKSPEHFRALNLSMEEKLVSTLNEFGFNQTDGSVLIQSFETYNLLRLKNMTNIPLIQLIWRRDGIQADTGRPYSDLLTTEALSDISKYAIGIGPLKTLVIPFSSADDPTPATTLVRDAHAVGLKVHCYTFRNETNYYDTLRFTSMNQEIDAFLAVGVDGIFTDFPDLGVSAKRRFLGISSVTTHVQIESKTSVGAWIGLITLSSFVIMLLIATFFLYTRYTNTYRKLQQMDMFDM